MFNRLTAISTTVLGFDAFCLGKKYLVVNLVNRNLKVKYRRSFLGFFWTVLSPLLMSCVYYFVFKVVLNVNKEHYHPFIISGVLPWAFFSQTINESTESMVANQALITKIPIPLHVFPYVTSLTNFATLAFAVPIIQGCTYFSNLGLSIYAIWILYFLFLLLLITYCIGAIFAVFSVYLRDLKHAIGLILQVWLYATPVLYDKSMIPEKYLWITRLNPVAAIFDGIHSSLIDQRNPDSETLIFSLAWATVFVVGLRITYKTFIRGLPERL